MKENIFKTVFAAALTGLTAYLGAIAIPVIVLLFVMISDYMTGMIKAWVTKQINSRIGVVGIVKKVSYMLVVCVGVVVDWIISAALNEVGIDFTKSFSFGLIIVIWLIINELISILENLGEIGVPLPGFLIKIIGKLKNTVNEKTGEDIIPSEKEQ